MYLATTLTIFTIINTISACTNEATANGAVKCKWFGSSPSCGNTKHQLGDRDKDGLVLVAWTKDLNIGKICPEKEEVH